MSITDFLDRLQHVKPSGANEWQASCPCSQNHANDDRKQSLSIKFDPATDKILLYCHTGCTFAQICEAIGCEPSDLSGKDKAESPAHSFVKWYAKENGLQFVEMYSYCYGEYNDGLAKIRFLKDGKKDFRWMSNEPKNKSGFKMKRGECPHRLYVAGSLEEDTIILVEGEKDANSVHRVFGFTSVSVENGASQTKIGKKWLPEYTQQLAGKTVYIIGDNDKVGESFLHIEAQQISGNANSVLIIDLVSAWPNCPDKGDITDFIESIGTEAAKEQFKSMMESAKPFDPSKELDNSAKSKKGGNRIDYKDSVLDLIEKAKIKQFGKALYRIEDGKYYKIMSDIFINHELICIRGMEPEKQKAAQTMVRSFQKEENVRFDRYYVGFKNGIMNWRTGDFFPYGQKDVPIFRYFDVNYNPEADTNYVDAIISDWCQGDAVKKEMIYELAGCCFYCDKPIKKWWVIEGKADTGKTTFLSLLKTIIGDSNIGSTPIQKLKDSNAIAELIDKPVNIVDDGSSNFASDLSNLRRIIQGDEMQVKLLYQNLFTTRLEARMIFVFNKTPRFRDDNDATAKKMLVIGFNRVYTDDEKDITLIDKLSTEENKEAFVCLAIDRMKKIINRNLIFTVSEESKRITARIIEESDQFVSFVADTISEDYGWRELLDEKKTAYVYETFKEWAIAEGYHNLIVRKQFTERCCKESGACIRWSHGSGIYTFRGE